MNSLNIKALAKEAQLQWVVKAGLYRYSPFDERPDLKLPGF
ncbi:MAG: hypothetical protein QNJ31_05915 [Candidatus Caenarcaniphilales bacterium]|nr:hypothetical protein [Candidatus Caenarcaniphilales bacterium]